MKDQVGMFFEGLHAADLCGGRGGRLLQRLDQVGCLSGRKGDQQAAAGLGIVDDLPLPGGQGAGETGMVGGQALVVGIDAGVDALAVHLQGLIHDGQGIHVDGEAYTRGFGHLQGMTGEAEAGDVGDAVDLERLYGPGGALVQGGQGGDALLQGRRGHHVFQVGVEEYAASQWLGQDQRVTRPGAGVGPEMIGVDHAHYRKPELGFVILDRVAAGQYRAGFGDFAQGAGDDPVQVVGRQLFGGEADQVGIPWARRPWRRRR